MVDDVTTRHTLGCRRGIWPIRPFDRRAGLVRSSAKTMFGYGVTMNIVLFATIGAVLPVVDAG